MVYQTYIKSPYWELEKIVGDKVLFSSRNSGCADFLSIPVAALIPVILEKGVRVECDFNGYFVKVVNDGA